MDQVATQEAVDAVRQLDHRQLAAMPAPYPLINSLREGCPVGHAETYDGFWNVFRYADVCAVALDAATFSNRDVTIPSENFPVPPPPIMSDPPVHMQFRKPFLKRFSPAVVADLEPDIRIKAAEFVDGFIERGMADLAGEMSIPFPAYAALRILGLPDADLPKFSRWARLVFAIPGEESEDAAWQMELLGYFAPLYEQRTGATDDSIPSIARRLRIDGRDIEMIEFVMLLTTFITAGLDTTTNALSNIVVLLDQRPDLRARLIEHPELIPTAVEEFLRYITPLPMLARTATRTCGIGSGEHTATMAEGEKVALHWLAANHDPAEFAEPEDVQLDRSPNRHVAFGVGSHLCIGMHLARVELRAALSELLTRIPDYQVVHDGPGGGIARSPALTRQIHRLPIRFTPGPRT
jgi:cytochrome P450